MQEPSERICILRISLAESEPRIWRRVVVPFDVTLDELHLMLQIAMGWEDAHLYEYEVNGQRYFDLERMEDPFGVMLSAAEVSLKSLGLEEGATFEYLYDFGDAWDHLIEVEEVRDAKPFEPIFGCRDGAGRCPPEDCGGIDGYLELLAAKKDNSHERREELEEWMNLEEFDPEEFDLDPVNEFIQFEFFLDEEELTALVRVPEADDNEEMSAERLMRSVAMATNNQMMADNPPETRLTLERLVVEGVDVDDAFSMIVSEVGAEIFESISSRKEVDTDRLIKRFDALPMG